MIEHAVFEPTEASTTTIPSIVTADLHDAHPDVAQICEIQFRSFGKKTSFAGPCVTLRTFEDHRQFQKIVARPGNGRVLVIDAGGSLRVAVMGDGIGKTALENGWAGAVINGALRDSAGINALAFGVKALGVTPRRSIFEVAGQADIPVRFGGVTFRPGDWVYADEDGLLVSPHPLTMS
jgi:regulator of ribonuclease activity A